MEDLLYYDSLFPQVREYSLISVEDLKKVIRTEKPLNLETLTRSKKRSFAGWLPMLHVLLAAIQEDRFIGPDWMSRFEMQIVHFPDQIPNLPEPPTFSSDSTVSILPEEMPTEEIDTEDFDMLPLAQSTPRHSSSDAPDRWSPIESLMEESSIQISFADSTIEDSITIEMNDLIASIFEPSSPQILEDKVLEFSYNSGFSAHRSDLLSPTSPPIEWVDETMEIDQAD